MTETEKILRKRIIQLETENEDLRRRMQMLEDMNFKIYRDNSSLNLYVIALERLRTDGSA
jgi:hypothetical protein